MPRKSRSKAGAPGWALASGIGLNWALSLLVGYAAGHWIGRHLGAPHIGDAVGLLAGAVAGFAGSIVIAKRALGE
ncbi:MAG TPA: AtpZ/AtpI family protein [Limnochordia bacterium]|nr:AtpZ/AtpI family protein [Limnochordia bacterium]